MVGAMLVGMLVLDLIRSLLAPGPALRADLETMVMATEMVIGMAVWMIARRHAWRGIAVMSAVMYLPFLLLAPLFWAGTISGGLLVMGGHLLMLPAMALAMPLTHRSHGQHGPSAMRAARSLEAVALSSDRHGTEASEAGASLPLASLPLAALPTPASQVKPIGLPRKALP
jgi:flagellar biosynthetic protein FliP